MFRQPHKAFPDRVFVDVIHLLLPEMLTDQTLRMPTGLPDQPVPVFQFFPADHRSQGF